MPLRIISYLAPSIPSEFFRLVAEDLGASIEFNETISGPLEGDDEPFTSARSDVGFVCSPTYRWLQPRVELLPLPVPLDPRAQERPVYFGDVVVRKDSAFERFDQLRGRVWAYNDRNSRSGWFSMRERAGESFFGRCVHSGSHLRSIEMVRSGAADAASIDSNVLLRHATRDLRVIESWGPFGIQPAIVRADLERDVKTSIARRLLTLHERHALEPFGFRRFVEPEAGLYASGDRV
ncbi:MAG TPA: PhnD/SsuA/transferrin family substrate-binding protein [Thermoanaerobaculia bacterium]|nr:PhnD/SsuA/transferrin family substrate-binding protein [Thermoanaerobaculia bacterium]